MVRILCQRNPLHRYLAKKYRSYSSTQQLAPETNPEFIIFGKGWLQDIMCVGSSVAAMGGESSCWGSGWITEPSQEHAPSGHATTAPQGLDPYEPIAPAQGVLEPVTEPAPPTSCLLAVGDPTTGSTGARTELSNGLDRSFLTRWTPRMAGATTRIHMENRMPRAMACPNEALLWRRIGRTMNRTWQHACCKLSIENNRSGCKRHARCLHDLAGCVVPPPQHFPP
jgi:hypothetical protein